MTVRVEALANVELDQGVKGGRWGEYRPNHNLGSAVEPDLVMGFMSIPEDQKLEPGQPREVVVNFYVPADYLSKLHPGRRWTFQEGGTRVGIGEIVGVRSCSEIV